MSKISLQPNASGAGTFSIVSPDSNTNRTLTLPDESGAVIAADASTGQFASSNMPAGSVIQVVQGTSNTDVTSNSTTYADYDLTASITPSSTSNNVLIMVTLAGVLKSFVNNLSKHRIVRGSSTSILEWNLLSPYNNTTDRHSDQMSVNYLDSPNTTSAVSYKIQFALFATTGTTSIGENNSVSTITLMEIAG